MTDTITISFPISELTSKYGFGQGDLDPEVRATLENWFKYPKSVVLDIGKLWFELVKLALFKANIQLAPGLQLKHFMGNNPVRLVDAFGEPVSVVEGSYLKVSQKLGIAEVEQAFLRAFDTPEKVVGAETTTAPDHIREAMRHLQEAEYLTEGLAVSGQLAEEITRLEGFVIYGIRE